MGIERVAAYLRVSTDEQGESGAGLSAQRDAIAREVEHRGWMIVGEHVDVASGKSRANRPHLEDALDSVRSGAAGTVMVSKLDRLSRSLIDFASIMADAQRERWNIVALDLGVDLSTPAGEFLASVMASAAQWERRIIGQRTADALRAKKKAGVRLGRPPLVTQDVRESIARWRDDDWSYAAIARALNAQQIPTVQGGKRWYPSTVRAVLERSTIAG